MSALRRLLLSLCFALLASPVLAQMVTRPIPAQAAAGQMSAISGNQVSIGNYTYHLAPGIQIRNPQNLIVVSDTLRNFSGTLVVRYLVDFHGEVSRIWILTDAEIAALDSSTLPAQPLSQPSMPTLAPVGRMAPAAVN